MNYLSNFGNFFIRPFFGTTSASNDIYDIQDPNELSFIQESKDIGLDVEEFDYIATDLTSKKIYNLKTNKHDSAELIGQKFHKQFGISNFSITYNYIFDSKIFCDTETQSDAAESCESFDEIQSNVSKNIHSNNSKNNEIDATESCKDITNLNIDNSKIENVLNEIRKNVVEVESDSKSENHSFEIVQNISNENSSIESENDEEDCQVHGCDVKEKHVHVERLNFDGSKLEDENGKEISFNTKVLINGEICIDGDSKAASALIPKIHENSKIVTLSLYDQIIPWYKLKPLLTDSTKNLNIQSTIINNYSMNVNMILKRCPNIEDFYLYCNGFLFNSEIILKLGGIISELKNLNVFVLNRLPKNFSLLSFYLFFMENQTVDITLIFDEDVRFSNDKNFDLFFKKLVENPPKKIPIIQISGDNGTAYAEYQKKYGFQ